ncbi:MAG TPA: hypothetical protein VN577_11065 [Terriglobales bacterium]|nr:hypothetical protein [Terriglobales bacterium]
MQFLVASGQCMQFLDLEAKVTVPVAAAELEPNHRYAVLLFLQNNECVAYENVRVCISHDPFEMSARGLSSLIIQPPPVDVPARVQDAQGVVMVRFWFITPSSGGGRLTASVLPNGPAIVQPVTINASATSRYIPDASSQATA